MFEETMIEKTHIQQKEITLNLKNNYKKTHTIEELIKESWKKIAPFWPLKNLIAINPLQGFEDLPIEKAMIEGATFFEQENLPSAMELINRQTIKWLQAFFDEGQATINMPFRTSGFYMAWKKLVYFDDQLHGRDAKKKKWILTLPDSPDKAITACLIKMNIPKEKQITFLSLMLTTLPGWASYIKYRINWTEAESLHPHAVSETDYIAIRLITTCLLWERAAELLEWHERAKALQLNKVNPIKKIQQAETVYLQPLLQKLASQTLNPLPAPDTQLIFCIDVRSEPFRRALESQGAYETFGYAGFFGVPVRIKNTSTEEVYTSCPVLLKPQHTVNESPYSSENCTQDRQKYQKLNNIKAIYQSLKYNFTTSFALVELLGISAGLWMALKTLTPILATKYHAFITKKIRPVMAFMPSLENISFAHQCTYAESALRTIGLTKNFSTLIVFCGHGSSTQNNAYATALDCGACGGRHGASNARILAKILNSQDVRDHLNQIGIIIPKDSYFIAAEHNTTTDEVEIYEANTESTMLTKKIQQLKADLEKARKINSKKRLQEMSCDSRNNSYTDHTKHRSLDWAQVRPEWGLARNASFIVAPREMSKKIDLEGRAFLHSYDYRQDLDGTILTGILTAPMVVAQWINSQYLFSTLNNVAYGSGSKITKNITGKFGVMQGNASDLMTGLPLQSVYKSDTEAYHEPVRLMTIVYAPFVFTDKVIKKQPVLLTLFRNGWVQLICIDPNNRNHSYFLDRNLTWKRNTSVLTACSS